MATATVSIESQIKQKFHDYMRKVGGSYSDWYVGISENPRDRLFNGHSVREKEDAWIYDSASSSDIARRIEKYFLALGCAGGPGGGDRDACGVYAYKKSWHTNP